MAAGGPWSVKGIAPQAREAAKDAARREGKTLGEWLNEIILETGEEAASPAGLAEDAPAAGPEPVAPAASSQTLDTLAQRLEAAEHRSTLAITGIDQSVRGLIARLEAAERSAGDVAERASESVSELHHAQSELARRLAELEADATADAGLQAVKTLEDAVARVAGHLHERDRKAGERTGELEQRLSDLDARLARAAEDLARRVDAASDHAAMQAQRTTNDLRATFETNQAKTADALASLEATIGRITQRLSAAESLTDNAMRSLEASFAHLDDRLRRAEQQAREASAENISEKLDQKFESLGRELRERIDQVRAETAQSIENTSPRLDRLERALEKANKRNARTLGNIGEQIGLLGNAVERRLIETERRLREDAIQDRTLETRLREVETSSSEAIRKVAESVEQISLRLAERIEASESRNSEAAAALGREVAKLTERLTPSGAKDEDVLAARLRESERRTQQMIRDAVAGVSAKLDAVRDETESGLSPVQSALANLAGRLEAIEKGDLAAAPPPVRPAPPRPEPARDEHGEETPRPYRSLLPPAEDALTGFGAEDETVGAEAPEDFAAAELESAELEAVEPEAAEPEEEIAIEPAARLNPFLDAPEEESTAAYSTPAESEALAIPDVIPMPAPEAVEESEPVEAPPQRPLGATADSNFLAAARKTARATPGAAQARDRASVLETRREERAATGRRVLILAGLLAIVTLGGAAWLLFRDGMPVGNDGARRAGELETSAVGSVLDDESAILESAPASAPARIDAAPIAPADTAAEPASASSAADTAEGATPTAADASTPQAAQGVEGAIAPEAETAVPEVAAVETAPAYEPAPAAIAEERAPTPAARIVSGAAEDAAPPAAIIETPSAAQAAATPPVPAAGDAASQFQLGEAQLQSGNPEDGARLIRSAANQGYPPAQYRLGKLYETGAAGVPQDDAQARQWTERAAVAGNRNAMHNLGLMYAEGRGGEQNDQMAAQWFERAAQLGATDSQFNLAVLYEQGRGVPQSLADAYAWYRIAERTGDVEAGERASLLLPQLPEAAVAEADRVAQAFQPRAVDPAANGAAGAPVLNAALTPAEQVRRTQQLLASLGYNPGPASGAIDPETRIAIVQYQRDAGLAETGTVDGALLASLEDAAAR